MYFEKDEVLQEGFDVDTVIQAVKLYKSLKQLHQTVKVEKRKIDKISNNIHERKRGSELLDNITSRIKIDDDYILIKGINFSKFIQRIKDYYSENNFSKIFMMEYTKHSKNLWEKKRIAKKDMTVKYLKFPIFFALEIAMIFEDLGDYYNVPYYFKIAKLIRTKTWVSHLEESIEDIPVKLDKLNSIRYTLKPYQKDFVEMYPTLKNRFGLNGYLLSFDQGLGKTLTSIALAESLNKKQIVIVCPNSLKENWAYEIKEYFYKYDNDKLWSEEVYVHGSKKYNLTKNTKYIIVNLEAIPAIYDIVNKKKDTMLIIDEMHNVRNMNGKRTKELLELRSMFNNIDVLPMSGTPIKALPNEIIPTLMLIDPLFTEEVAKIYDKCFNVDGIGTKNIVNSRFGIIMHRKTKKEVLALPEKVISSISFKVPNSSRYLSSQVKEDVNEIFSMLYNKELDRSQELQVNFINMVKKYSKAPNKDLTNYLNYVKKPNAEYHEIDLKKYGEFTKLYVIPNIYSPVDIKKFKDAETAYLRMKERAMGKAIGQVLHPRRKEMFIQLYENNKDHIIEMINNATKKTVIFSTLLEVVDYISKDLEKQGVGNVKIVGGSGDRMDKIQTFKNNEDVQVLIATSQTLSTGVTLTEANQMFFFGTPWRSADYNQCCDRIYRIGQNTDVHIYNVLLDTGGELNLSTRMNDILQWSDTMFNSMIEGE